MSCRQCEVYIHYATLFDKPFPYNLKGYVRAISCYLQCEDGNAIFNRSPEIWSILWRIFTFFLSLNVLNSYIFFCSRNAHCSSQETTSQNNCCQDNKHNKHNLIQNWLDTAFKVVVNRTLSSLHGGLLEITLTVP